MSASSAREARDKRLALAVLGLAQLMIVLDVTIVGVALPSIQTGLQITPADQQWVVTAYTLPFAGLLLLSGRVADRIGSKRVFLAGVLGFAASSVLGGTAVTPALLIAARAGQGTFAAVTAPALLALLTTTFREPAERARAFGVFGAVSGGGAALGLVLGGAVTQAADWRWVFFVNVPIAVLAAIGGRRALREHRVLRPARFDATGAVLASCGLVAIVQGFRSAADNGWAGGWTLALLGAGVVLLVAFGGVESRQTDPLLPGWIVSDRTRAATYLANLVLGVGLFGASFFLTFYLQAVRGYSPLQAGFAFLPQVAGVLVATIGAGRIARRVPAQVLLPVGLLIGAGGLLVLWVLTLDSAYPTTLLPGLFMLGVGLGLASPTAANLATAHIGDRDSGVASGLVNTSQQVGASLGTALLNTVAVSQTANRLADGIDRPAALTAGYTLAFGWAATVLAVGAVLVALLSGVHGATPTADSNPPGSAP